MLQGNLIEEDELEQHPAPLDNAPQGNGLHDNDLENNVPQGNLPVQEGEPGPDNGHSCRVNVSKPQYCGFFRKIQSVLVPQISAEINILEGDLDEAQAELKLAKGNYKRRGVYISGTVAAIVAILQLSKQFAVSDESASMAIDFTSALIPIIGTALTLFNNAWDETADDHLREIAESQRKLVEFSPV